MASKMKLPFHVNVLCRRFRIFGDRLPFIPYGTTMAVDIHSPISHPVPIGVRTKYTSSYIHGHDAMVTDTFPTPLGKTVGQFVDESAETFRDKECLVFPETEERMNFQQFREQVDRLAAGLLSIGVERGDRVGIWGPNSLQWVLTQFATARIGAILVTLNPAYQPAEIEYALRKVGVKALIAAKSFKIMRYYDMLAAMYPDIDTTTPGHLQNKRLPELRSIIIMGDESLPGAFALDDVMDMGRNEHHDVIDRCRRSLQFDDVINIQFTSGTTGLPKAACLTHANIINGIWTQQHIQPTIPNEVHIIPSPMFHIMGMGSTLDSFIRGTPSVYPSTGYDPLAILRAIQDERGTHFFGPPTMLIDMLHHPEFATFDLSTMQSMMLGGSSVPAELLRQLQRDMPTIKDHVIIYGMTESSGTLTRTLESDSEQARLSTAGRPLPWTENRTITVLMK